MTEFYKSIPVQIIGPTGRKRRAWLCMDPLRPGEGCKAVFERRSPGRPRRCPACRKPLIEEIE